jgi:predicted MPP superfamily phosphohydrolase
MKDSGFIMFLIIALSIYSLVNFYIFNRGWPATSWMGVYRYIVLAVFLLMVLGYPVGRFAERVSRTGFTEFLLTAGSYYMALMTYFLLLALLIDLLRLGNYIFHYFPLALERDSRTVEKAVFLGGLAATLVVVIAGHVNALHPRIRTLNLSIQKAAGDLKRINIVMASDIHLGRNVSSSWLKEVVEKINGLEPDLVLLPGDIMDEDVDAMSDFDMAAVLRGIRARYGVFAATGNHEYYRGLKETVSYIRQGNVQVLEDAAVKVGEALYIIGRKDRTAEGFGKGRKSLRELIENVDRSLPMILMDHQPFHLEEAEQNGVDLQLSGHTHHGQLFPFQWITKAVYEISWGYLRKGVTHYYVSCGLGTWGPPVRTGNAPEIVKIVVTFNEGG